MADCAQESEYDLAFGEHADRHSASDEYARRFAGPIGKWLLDVQSGILRKLVAKQACANCLDVGGGHAQVVSAIYDLVPQMSVLVSAADAADQLLKFESAAKINLLVAKLSDSQLPEKSYQLVTCFRILSHTTDWQRLIAELCRLAKDRVIVDYPLSASANILEPLLFRFKRDLEGNTRKFLLFKQGQVEQEFARAGFELTFLKKQFFLPMVFHRTLKSPLLSSSLEFIARALGLTALFGSPAIAQFSRRVV